MPTMSVKSSSSLAIISIFFIVTITVTQAIPVYQDYLRYYVNDYSDSRSIRPLTCRSFDGTVGVCMFSLACRHANGRPIGLCKDTIYSGSCCQLPEGSTDPHSIPVIPEVENFLEYPVGSNRTSSKVTTISAPQSSPTLSTSTSSLPFSSQSLTTSTTTTTTSTASTLMSTSSKPITTTPMATTTIISSIPPSKSTTTSTTTTSTTTSPVPVTTGESSPLIISSTVPTTLSTSNQQSTTESNIVTSSPMATTVTTLSSSSSLPSSELPSTQTDSEADGEQSTKSYTIYLIENGQVPLATSPQPIISYQALPEATSAKLEPLIENINANYINYPITPRPRPSSQPIIQVTGPSLSSSSSSGEVVQSVDAIVGVNNEPPINLNNTLYNFSSPPSIINLTESIGQSQSPGQPVTGQHGLPSTKPSTATASSESHVDTIAVTKTSPPSTISSLPTTTTTATATATTSTTTPSTTTTAKTTTTTTTTTPVPSTSTTTVKINTLNRFTSPSTVAPKNNTNLPGIKAICGRKMNGPGPTARIVGGSQSSFSEWPWMVSTRQWKKNAFLHKCGAALLNEYWAITAAHCVENVAPTDLLLRLGEYDISHEDEPFSHIERRVQIIAPHPKFDPRTFEYDLALLRFYEPITFRKNILPICIPEGNKSYVGRKATVTGWGRLYEEGPLPNTLQHVDVPVITNQECEMMYRRAGYLEEIPNIFICAGMSAGGKDSCEGDSGGPLVIEENGQWNLIGIISWGIGCALPNQPGVYTRITEFSRWIHQIIAY